MSANKTEIKSYTASNAARAAKTKVVPVGSSPMDAVATFAPPLPQPSALQMFDEALFVLVLSQGEILVSMMEDKFNALLLVNKEVSFSGKESAAKVVDNFLEEKKLFDLVNMNELELPPYYLLFRERLIRLVEIQMQIENIVTRVFV